MAKNENLTDEQWAILEPLIAQPKRRDDGRGRPWRENREVPRRYFLDIANRRALAGFAR
jgi:transposase